MEISAKKPVRKGKSMADAVIRASGSDLASFIIHDFELVVQRIYILIETLLANFYYLADISFLATVYCLLTLCFLSSGGPHREKPSKSIKALGWIHFLFLLVLIGLWIGIMVVSIRYQVEWVKYSYDSKLVRPWQDLDLAYLVLYLCGTIEILVWAIMMILKSRKKQTGIKVSFLPRPNNFAATISVSPSSRF